MRRKHSSGRVRLLLLLALLCCIGWPQAAAQQASIVPIEAMGPLLLKPAGAGQRGVPGLEWPEKDFVHRDEQADAGCTFR